MSRFNLPGAEGEIGRLALDTLFDRMRADDPAAAPPRHVQVVPQLTVRRSCGAALPEPV